MRFAWFLLILLILFLLVMMWCDTRLVGCLSRRRLFMSGRYRTVMWRSPRTFMSITGWSRPWSGSWSRSWLCSWSVPRSVVRSVTMASLWLFRPMRTWPYTHRTWGIIYSTIVAKMKIANTHQFYIILTLQGDSDRVIMLMFRHLNTLPHLYFNEFLLQLICQQDDCPVEVHSADHDWMKI